MHERPRHPLAAYGVALVATALSLFVRWPLWPLLGNAVPQMTFLPAVMIAAYYGGFWPGILATVLSAATANYFVVAQPPSFHFSTANDIAAFVLFIVVGTIISALCESLHRVRRHLIAEERQRSEGALRENEERFRQLAENIHEIFWIRDARDGELLYRSPGFEEIWGRAVQGLHHSPHAALDSIHPDDRDGARQRMEQQRRGESTDAELRVVRPDGSIRWIRSRGFPIKDANGGLSRLAGLAEDITQRKQAEEALRESEKRLNRLLDALPAAAYTCDADGLITYFNERAVELWGRSPKLNHGDDRYCGSFRLFEVDGTPIPHDQCGMAVAMKEKREIKGLEVVIERNDGSRRSVLAHINPMWGSDGRLVGAMNVVVDITDLKKAQDALGASEQRFRTFVDHATDSFFLFDEKNVVLDINRQACQSLGYKRTELLGKRPTEFDPDVTDAALEEMERKLDAGEPIALEARHRRKDGTIFPVEIRGQPFWEGGRRYAVCLVRDISDRKRDDALLDSQKRILERIIQGDPLVEVLAFLCRTIEELAGDEMLASVLLLDADGVHLRHGAAPSLPEAYIEAIDGLPIGPGEGSCGSAAYRGKPVFVSDIANDPLWTPYAELALSHGLQACWSSPIFSSAAEVLGTFAMYYRQPRKPTAHDLRVVDIVARTVAIAIERSRAEQALRESEQRWRSLTEALPQLVWTAMPDGSCDYFSTQWTQHTGFPESELLGWRWLQTLHPDDREPTRLAWLAAVEGPGTYDVEYRVRRADGEYRWFKTRGLPVRDHDGNIVNWFGTCTDMTDSKRTEEALRESEERFRGTFENAAVGIANIDFEGRWLRVNQRLCDIVGRTREELLQTTFQEITYPDDLSISSEQFTPFTRGEISNYSYEKRYVRKDGSLVWVEIFGALQRDAAGKPAYAIAMIQDISDRKRLEGALRQAKDAAEAANRAKDEFLANVSHEIRTPMNAILGMTELVLDTALGDDQRQSLRTVKSAADNLLGIINDLLDFSKIEAGKLELDIGNFSLRAAVGDTVRALAMRAHRKGLELVCNVQQDVPDALIGDAGRLRQVLLNLIGNAIKFTDKGEVVVQVDIAGEGRAASAELAAETDVSLQFTVRDTGIGIPLEKQSTIFRAFEQEDTSTTRKYGGTGLGLTISAQLAAIMGGSIGVKSEVGRGSTFSFFARFARQAHQTPGAANVPPVLLHNLRVLVVDDNAANRHIMEQWLRDWQMEATTVADGMAAMDALWHGVAIGKPHRLLLLDARMPDTDGLTLASKIRERAELGNSRIILLTSGDRPGDLTRFRELRVDGHLLKPLQQDELLEAIYSIMSRTTEGDKVTRWQGGKVNNDASVSQSTSSPPDLVTKSSSKLRILVAEDSEFNAQLMEKLLAKRGHTVRVASNGTEALELADVDGFDLLFLDLHMPKMDGFQVIRAIRERERETGSHLPVIALTARSRAEDRELCLAEGMDDFLAKPIKTEDLWETVERVTRLGAPAEGKVPSLIDPRALLAACGDDAAILKVICETLRQHLPAHVAEVQEAYGHSDATRLREAAHKLYGIVAAFSTLAGNVASDIEQHAARGQLGETARLIERLNEMAAELPGAVCDVSIESLRRAAGNRDGRNGS